MTFNHKEASELIAEFYDISAYVYFVNQDNNPYLLDNHYITQDLGVLMELAIRNHIPVDYDYPKEATICEWITFKPEWKKDRVVEQYADHNNDPIEATRVAIAKALIKKGGM